jgi:hypothetical protein
MAHMLPWLDDGDGIPVKVRVLNQSLEVGGCVDDLLEWPRLAPTVGQMLQLVALRLLPEQAGRMTVEQKMTKKGVNRILIR